MTDRIFLCRCEDVTDHDVDDACARGLTSIEEVKRYTGLGTGPCQGKECLATACRYLAGRGHPVPAPFTPRAPVEPVSMGTLAAADDDGEDRS